MTTAIDEAPSAGRRAFRNDAYVDRVFERVRSYVSASPESIIGDGAAGLHLRRAGLDLSREVEVTLGDLEMGSRFARISLHWADARLPSRFPVLDAVLEINPAVSDGRPTTQLVFTGSYRPPFGALGIAADRLVGRYLVLQSVDEFLGRLVRRLEREIPPDPVRWKEEP